MAVPGLQCTSGSLRCAVAGIEDELISYEYEMWMILTCCCLVGLAAAASGLTVGLLSLEQLELRMVSATGSADDRHRANRVLNLITQRHLLMVTLLLTNAIAMESLPVFLDKIVPSWAAVTLSVTAILIFGEIVPQAYCTGPNQLYIAYTSAPFMEFLIVLFYPIAKPISLMLDMWFGAEHQNYYDRRALKTLIALHRKERPIQHAFGNDQYNGVGKQHTREKINERIILGDAGVPRIDHMARSSTSDEHEDSDRTSDVTSASGLEDDEIVVIQGALDLSEKNVNDIYTPIAQVFMVEASSKLTLNTRRAISQSGFSRIPVYKEHRHNIIGIMLVKSLLDLIPVPDDLAPCCGECIVAHRSPLFVGPQVSLWCVLNIFQKGKTHIAFVTKNPKAFVDQLMGDDVPVDISLPGHTDSKKELLGVITLEDIFEELIQEEIYDEYDFKKKPEIKSLRYPSPHDSHLHTSNNPQQVDHLAEALMHNKTDHNMYFPTNFYQASFTGGARHRIGPKLMSMTENDISKLKVDEIKKLYGVLSNVVSSMSTEEQTESTHYSKVDTKKHSRHRSSGGYQPPVIAVPTRSQPITSYLTPQYHPYQNNFPEELP